MKRLFKSVKSFWLTLFYRLAIFGIVFTLIWFYDAKQEENFENIQRFHNHVKNNHYSYIPPYIDDYIAFLEKELNMDLKDLRNVQFYPLEVGAIDLACDFHEGPEMAILGCFFEYDKDTVYIRISEALYCETELHELLHASLHRQNLGVKDTIYLSNMHNHYLYREYINEAGYTTSPIQEACREIYKSHNR